MASACAIRSRVRIRSTAASGRILSRFEPCRRRRRSRAVGHPAPGPPPCRGAHGRQLVGGRRIVRDESIGQARRPELETGCARRPDRVDDAELGAAAADVDDQRLVGDRHPLGHADEREVGLLLVRQDVERRSGRQPDLVHDRGGIGGPPDRLRAEERDVAGTQAASRLGIAAEGRGELGARGAPEEPALDDRRAEPEEDGFVDQRLESMARDRRDEEMDRIGTEVDRRPDDPIQRDPIAVEWGPCRSQAWVPSAPVRRGAGRRAWVVGLRVVASAGDGPLRGRLGGGRLGGGRLGGGGLRRGRFRGGRLCRLGGGRLGGRLGLRRAWPRASLRRAGRGGRGRGRRAGRLRGRFRPRCRRSLRRLASPWRAVASPAP